MAARPRWGNGPTAELEGVTGVGREPAPSIIEGVAGKLERVRGGRDGTGRAGGKGCQRSHGTGWLVSPARGRAWTDRIGGWSIVTVALCEMREERLAVELLETRHVRDAFKAMPVKTDRKDARGIAHLMRLGWFRPVHCKSLPAPCVASCAALG